MATKGMKGVVPLQKTRAMGNLGATGHAEVSGGVTPKGAMKAPVTKVPGKAAMPFKKSGKVC